MASPDQPGTKTLQSVIIAIRDILRQVSSFFWLLSIYNVSIKVSSLQPQSTQVTYMGHQAWIRLSFISVLTFVKNTSTCSELHPKARVNSAMERPDNSPAIL